VILTPALDVVNGRLQALTALHGKEMASVSTEVPNEQSLFLHGIKRLVFVMNTQSVQVDRGAVMFYLVTPRCNVSSGHSPPMFKCALKLQRVNI